MKKLLGYIFTATLLINTLAACCSIAAAAAQTNEYLPPDYSPFTEHNARCTCGIDNARPA